MISKKLILLGVLGGSNFLLLAGKLIAIFPILHGPSLGSEFVAELVGGGPIFRGTRGPAGFSEFADGGGDVCRG